MNKLLSAGFARVTRDKLFWVCMIFMAGIAAFVVITGYFNQFEYNFIARLDDYFLGCFILIGMTIPVFCSLFLGTEYSDGTIRNKLVVGHTRTSIYLSNLALTFIAGLFMCLVSLVAVSAVGIPLLGILETGLDVVFIYLLCGLVTLAAVSSIYTLIAMLCHNKATSAVVSILLAVLLFFFLVQVNDVLQSTEVTNAATIKDGELVMEQVQNSDYPSETKRAVFEFFRDFLPNGQAAQIANFSADKLRRLPLFSLLLFLGSTAGGLFFFRKKNLK